MGSFGIFPLEVKVSPGSGIVQNRGYLTAQVGKIYSLAATWMIASANTMKHAAHGPEMGRGTRNYPFLQRNVSDTRGKKPHVAKIRKGRIKRSLYAGEKTIVNTFCSCTAFILAENGTDLRRTAENMKSV